MSRIGKIPVDVPKSVKVTVTEGIVHIEGTKGKLVLNIPRGIIVIYKDEKLAVNRISNLKQNRANHGTIRSRLLNMVKGVTDGHKRELEIQGLGFRTALKGRKLEFILGFSHPVEFEVPEDLKVTVPNQTSIVLEGADNERLGQIAAKIRSLKPVEPYKGKGIRYLGEVVRRKQGKSATK